MSVTQINGGTQIQSATITNTQIASAAGIATTKLADGALFIKSDGSVAMGANLDIGTHNIINVSNPVSAGDAANKAYVDLAIQGLSQKPTARLATAAPLPAGTYANGSSGVGATFTVTATGTLTVDGVVTALGDIILVKNQSAGAQNGLYKVTTAGAGGVSAVLTRHTSMDEAGEFDGAFIPVDDEGTANKNTLWLVNNLGVVVVGTTAITFTQLASATSYSAGTGISIVGTTISVDDTAVPLFSRTVVRETPSGTVNGSNATFTLANTPISGTESLYLNGILQDAGAGNDYTISSGTITMLAAPVAGDKLRVSYWF